VSVHLKWALWFSALAQLAACSFESANKTGSGVLGPTNKCTLSTDCAPGSTCREGLCVAKSADAPLNIALQITPQRALAGADPLPVIVDRFVLQGPDTRSFALPASITVHGTIRYASHAIPAQISFTPVSVIPGVSVKAVTATVVPALLDPPIDYSVQLLSGVPYRMLVQPKDPQDPQDPALPPYARMFTANPAASIQSVEYQDITAEQKFEIVGLPSDRSFLLSAFDQKTGESVSSTTTLTGNGVATLQFASPDPEPFRLQIRAAQSSNGTAAGPSDQTSCANDTPATLSINQQDLGTNAAGNLQIVLPVQPPRIAFMGTVDLCAEEKDRAATIAKLPVTLHSHALQLNPQSGFTATFDASTDAIYDNDTKKFIFCTQALPGEYDVVATPPPGTGCAVFAERRLVQPPQGNDMTANGTLLQLPSATSLTGTLQTTDGMMVQGATVEAVALGRMAMDPQTNDVKVTRYNRSQQTTTDAAGKFKLPVDQGTYDILFKPPAGSGFAWQVSTDVVIGPRPTEFGNSVNLLSPVSLMGTLVGGPRSIGAIAAALDSAQIEAYAVVMAPEGERSILLGKAMADQNGHFMLLLPPSTHSGW
jgi:hypothetical protein